MSTKKLKKNSRRKTCLARITRDGQIYSYIDKIRRTQVQLHQIDETEKQQNWNKKIDNFKIKAFLK